GADTARLREIFTDLGFTRFLKSVPVKTMVAASYRTILSAGELAGFADEVKRAGRLAIEIHATSRDAMTCHVCGIAMSHRPGDAVYVPVGHRYLGAPAQLTMDDFAAAMSSVLGDASIPKVGHDMKFNEVVLRKRGIAIEAVT